MTTLTLTQRIEEGDTAMERSATIQTDAPSFNLITVGDKLIGLLHNATWSTPEQQPQSAP